MLSFAAAMFMSIMDSTIVNVALPSLARQLGAPNLAAYHAAFLAAAVLALVAACIALTVHDRDAAATMQRQASHTVRGDTAEQSPIAVGD